MVISDAFGKAKSGCVSSSTIGFSLLSGSDALITATPRFVCFRIC